MLCSYGRALASKCVFTSDFVVARLILTQIERDSLQGITDQNDLPKKAFTSLLKTLDKACDILGVRMSQETAALRRANRKSSPTKPRPAGLPSQQTPSKRVFLDLRVQETPSKKRRVTGADDAHVMPSPFTTPAVSPSRTALDSRRVSEEGARRSRRIDVIDAENDGGAEGGVESRTPRRFRPIFLDQKQWFCRDEQAEDVWKEAETHSNQMTALYGHPFESYLLETNS